MNVEDQSAIKPVAIGLYLLFGIGMMWRLQAWHRVQGATFTVPRIFALIGAAVLVAGTVLLVVSFQVEQASTMTAAALIAAGFYVALQGRTHPVPALVIGAAAAILPVSLAWWAVTPAPLQLLSLAAFALVMIAVSVGLGMRREGRGGWSTAMGIFIAAGLLLLLDLGGYTHNLLAMQVLAHHWGAFIGPALHVQAGLVPFYDVPLQYGAGPTALIVALCGYGQCWRGGEVAFAASTLLYGALILDMALTGLRRASVSRVAATTVAVFAAVMLWTGMPHVGSLAIATPSTGGMRYLPVCLVAWLLFRGHARSAAAMFALAVMWSPETAAMAIAVYGAVRTADRGIFAAGIETGLLTFTSATVFVVVHRLIFAVWIEPAVFFEYILHVPGPWPIAPVSDTLVLASALVIGGVMVARPPSDPVVARHDRVVTMLLFAAVSVWFGRSHPNNICNIAPFILLVVLRVIDRSEHAGRVALQVAVGTSVGALALSPWKIVPYDPNWRIDPDGIAAETVALEPGIGAIRARIANPGGLGIADFGTSMVRRPSERIVWTALDPASLWTYVPHARRQLYLARTSARLRRSGFGIFEQNLDPFIRDFSGGYRIASVTRVDGPTAAVEISTRHYTVVCFDPILAPGAVQVGPRCPTLR